MVMKHRPLCFKEYGEPTCFAPSKSSSSNFKRSRCSYCDARTYKDLKKCWKFQHEFPLSRRTTLQPPPALLSILFQPSEKVSEDEEEEAFSRYDAPR